MNDSPRYEQKPVTFRGADGNTIAGDSWGDPGDSPVLLLHGGGQTSGAWRETGTRLAERRFHAVAIDLRGHGRSDWVPGRYAVDDFAADLLTIAQEFDQRPAAVGASLGGLSALLAIGESIDLPFSALVLVDVAPRMEIAGRRRILRFMSANPDGFASVEEAADAISAYMPHRERPANLGGLQRNLRRGDDGRYRWHWDPLLLDGERTPVAAQHRRLIEAARRLQMPTLVVRGAESEVLGEAGVREFLEVVPHCRLADVRGARHMVAGDQNDAFTAAVVDFLEGTRHRS